MIDDEIKPRAVALGIGFEEFEDMTPKDVEIYRKAVSHRDARNEKEMLLLATYFREAFDNVLANAFGKTRKKWRTKTYTEEYEANDLSDESVVVVKRREHALEMDTLRRNFLLAKTREEFEQQG